MPRWKPFATALPKAVKPHAGRTGIGATPVAIRSKLSLSGTLRDDVRRRLARKVGKYATHIERLAVRFEDGNGPKGGVDVACRVEAIASALPSVVVEGRAGDAELAFRRAAAALATALGRTLDRAGFSAPRDRGAGRRKRKEKRRRAAAKPTRSLDQDESLIGARVGQGAANVELALDRPEKRRRDVPIDTALPGTSASDRRAGYGHSAARNTKRNTAGMQAALEDSLTTPSRKSTRRSINRVKAATPLQRTHQLAAHAPGARAMREGAAKGPRGVR